MKDSGLRVNTSRLRRDSMSQNKKAISNLSKAREQLAQKIEMPEKFVYSSLLNNIPERIKKVEGTVSEINSYIDRKADDFEKAEKEAERLASSLSVAMLNSPDYEYYMMTQGANKKNGDNTLFPYSDASLGQKYEATMANVRDKNFLSFLNAVSKIGPTAVYAAEPFRDNKTNTVLTNNIRAEAIRINQETKENWIDVKIEDNSYGLYVDKDGTILTNKEKNGIEFDKDGIAIDYVKFNMMKKAVDTDIPKGIFKDHDREIEIKQDTLMLIDDDSYKCGILKKNDSGEWNFEYYVDCSNGRNPNVRTTAGEYITTGRMKHKADEEDVDSSFIVKKEGSQKFFYVTWITDFITGKAANYSHTVAYSPETHDPKAKNAKVSDDKLGTDVTNGCIRLPLNVAEDIYNNYSSGVYIKVYEQKDFGGYNKKAQKEAIDEWVKKIKKAKKHNNLEQEEQIKDEIKKDWGDAVLKTVEQQLDT